MADLQTTYMGIPLESPVIAGASTLTGNLRNIKEIEDAGAGAIVTRSLFEEQIQIDQLKFYEELYAADNREAENIVTMPALQHAGPVEYLDWLKHVKKSVRIPVIGSLNAVSRDIWIEYAWRMQKTGIDALECNFFTSPTYCSQAGQEIEEEHLHLVRLLRQTLSIPFSIKLSNVYSNPLNIIARMDEAGATGFVFFNRMFEPDVDTDRERMISPLNFTHKSESRMPLRYAGLMYETIDAGICCGTGIYSGDDVIRMILAGADTVQTVSALYAYGIDHIRSMNSRADEWMKRKGYASLSEIRGKLSKHNLRDQWAYNRAQYARLMMNPSGTVRTFPQLRPKAAGIDLKAATR